MDCVYLTPGPPPPPDFLTAPRPTTPELAVLPSPPNLSVLVPPHVPALVPPSPHSLHQARSMPHIREPRAHPLWETRSAASASTATTDLTWTTAQSYHTADSTPETALASADSSTLFSGGNVFDDLFSDVFGQGLTPGTTQALPAGMLGSATETYIQMPPGAEYAGQSARSGAPNRPSPTDGMQIGPFPPQALILAQTQGELWLAAPVSDLDYAETAC